MKVAINTATNSFENEVFGVKKSFQNIRGKKSNIHFNEIGNCLHVQNVLVSLQPFIVFFKFSLKYIHFMTFEILNRFPSLNRC